MLKLGDKVKDVISGFTGIATARTEWLNGCVRFRVEPQELDKDGKLRGDTWFDAEQLCLVEPGVIKIERLPPDWKGTITSPPEPVVEAGGVRIRTFPGGGDRNDDPGR